MSDTKYGSIPGIPDDEPCFVIRAKDQCAVDALLVYATLADGADSPHEHVEAVYQRVHEFQSWRAVNAAKVKVPD